VESLSVALAGGATTVLRLLWTCLWLIEPAGPVVVVSLEVVDELLPGITSTGAAGSTTDLLEWVSVVVELPEFSSCASAAPEKNEANAIPAAAPRTNLM